MAATTGSRAKSFIETSKGKTGAEADVGTPNAAYLGMLERWQLVNDLMGGTPAMRAAGQLWLTKFPNETAVLYKARLNAATLFNVFLGTLQHLVGRVFREPIELTEGTDPRIKKWAEDIDRSGRDLTAYGQDCFTDMLAFGKCHTMPEFPDAEQVKRELGRTQLTLEDQNAYSLRPYFAKVNPMNLFAWDGAMIAGAEVLERIRIYESAWVREGEWGQAQQKTIRVVEPNTVRIYTWNGEEWVAGQEDVTTLGQVNLTTGYARRTGFLMAAPPLEDLAWLNRKHWDSQSDQDNILHVVRAAILLVQGFTEKEMAYVNVGPSIALRTDKPPSESAVGYVEHTGEGVDAGQRSLDNLVDQMRASGAGDLTVSQPGTETATGRSIEEAKSLSPLGAAALALQLHLEESFKMAGRWDGDPGISVGVRVNTDLGTWSEVTKEIELLQADATAGRISDRDYLDEAQRRGLYDAEKSIDDMLENAESEADSDFPDVPFEAPLELPDED